MDELSIDPPPTNLGGMITYENYGVTPVQPQLWPALLRARQRIGVIPKSATNPHFDSKYAPLDEILEVVSPILWAEGLILTGAHGPGSFGMRVVHVGSGEYHEVLLPIADGTSMHKVCAAVTYIERYAIGALLALIVSVDDDGNTASDSTPKSTAKTVQATPRPAQSVHAPRSTAPTTERGSDELLLRVESLIDLLDANDTEWKFRSNSDRNKIGVFGKTAHDLGVTKGQYSLAQLASRGLLPALYDKLKKRAFAKGLLKKDPAPESRYEEPPPITDDDLPF